MLDSTTTASSLAVWFVSEIVSSTCSKGLILLAWGTAEVSPEGEGLDAAAWFGRGHEKKVLQQSSQVGSSQHSYSSNCQVSGPTTRFAKCLQPSWASWAQWRSHVAWELPWGEESSGCRLWPRKHLPDVNNLETFLEWERERDFIIYDFMTSQDILRYWDVSTNINQTGFKVSCQTCGHWVLGACICNSRPHNCVDRGRIRAWMSLLILMRCSASLLVQGKGRASLDLYLSRISWNILVKRSIS